jgi:hypothetical protein
MNRTMTNFARRLHPSPAAIATAAAQYDPGLLLQLQAATPAC